MKVPFVDLGEEHAPYRDALLDAFDGVLRSGQYVMGERLLAFEARMAADIGVDDVVGVSSGTDALLLALLAHDIGPGDVVVTTPYSFYSTAAVALRVGAEVAFVDIDPATYNLDPAAVRRWFETDPRASRAKAILAVHLFGRAADVEQLQSIAHEHDAVLIEDAAQAIGTHGDHGLHVGATGALGCFSFFPTKNLGGFGDGGAVTTNDGDLADRVRSLRSYGASARLVHERLGGNHRLDEVQAAWLLVLLDHLETKNQRRHAIATRYNEAFGPDRCPVRPPAPARHAYHQYVIRVPEGRDDLMVKLAADDIATNVYYRTPLHRQPCFIDVDPNARLPHTEHAAATTLALPIRPTMSDEMVEFVIQRIHHHAGD